MVHNVYDVIITNDEYMTSNLSSVVVTKTTSHEDESIKKTKNTVNITIYSTGLGNIKLKDSSIKLSIADLVYKLLYSSTNFDINQITQVINHIDNPTYSKVA